MTRKIRRLFIANRGEIAVRIIRTCRQLGIETCTGYSAADRHALFVREADFSVELGPSPARESYLNAERILESARHLRADAIHPGYGFLSENADFARMVNDSGLIFIGPTPETIARMGDKIAARREMEKIGVPVVPGSAGNTDLSVEAARIGYPVLIKAAHGGGGRGMRIVESPADLEDAIRSAGREALSAFGNDSVFMEKYILQPRHIEVQILGDVHGNCIHLFERDCSIQRRHQKVVEESPAPQLPKKVRDEVLKNAVQAMRGLNYQNAGTVEFVYSPADETCYFLEINTRLQVEHPVTELVTGLDLVELQIRIAEGFSLQDLTVNCNGHAVEVRLNAEDPAQNFLPQSGTVHHFELPTLPGVRLDSGIGSGSTVSVYYDSMLAKLIAWGENRNEALDRLSLALEKLCISGIRHNGPFLRQVIDHPAFRAGQVHTGFLASHFAGGFAPTPPPREQSLARAAAALLHATNARYLPQGTTGTWALYPSFEIWKG